MTQLRPISLRNVLYKIVAKVLMNRLKAIFPRIIAPTQSAFIPGHLVSYNYLVATEVAHYKHKRSPRSNGLMALKLDISKAYDPVEWRFLKAMMSLMRFSKKSIEMIM
ncbi:hypothetical protein ACFX2B_029933 [Malus domestica]